MALVHCAECGHEVSTNAVACANCGRPLMAPPVEERRVVAVPAREDKFPPWAIPVIAVSAIVLLFLAYFMLRDTDESSNLNVNVNAAGRRTATEPSRTTTVPSTDTQVQVPATTTVPGTTTTTTVPGTTTTVPGSSVPIDAPVPDKGTVVINAKVAPARGGSPTSVRNARFYLLEKDVETILSEARIEPIEGNSLTASLGLAIVFPERYGSFSQAAMRAIANRSKYSGTTDGAGKAGLKGVEPGQFYLFGVTKVGRGFALWNSPVSIIAGENVMNLSPQSVTEIPDAE